MTAHWGLADPAAVQGTEEQQRKAFFEAYVALRRRIELMLALPIEALDQLSLHGRLADIGKA
jgi:arsenate reductase